jgi:hypothetical protein
LPRDEEWAQAFTLIRAWEIEPVVFGNLRSLPNETIPQAILEQASHEEMTARAEALKLSLLTGQLFGKFQARGIAAIALKGAAIGAMAYDDVSLRTFGDVDFFISTRDIGAARDTLLESGYTRNYEPHNESILLRGGHALEFTGVGCHAELHTSLIERHLGFRIGEIELFGSAVTIDCGGTPVRAMGKSELLVFLCAHGAKHEWPRLRWVIDIAQLVDRMNQQERARAVEVAESAHATRILALGLRLSHLVSGQAIDGFARSLADDSLSDMVKQTTARLGLSPAVTNSLPRTAFDSGHSALIFWSRTRERMIDRVAPFARVLFVPTEKDRQSALGWLTRPMRILSRLARRT